jgi:hypothetical protein
MCANDSTSQFRLACRVDGGSGGDDGIGGVSLSMNLAFNTPGNALSGGTWKIVGKADERGLAGVAMRLDNINFNATGFLAPAGFEIKVFQANGTVIEIVEGDDLSSKTLDVGVIGGPFPSSYVDAPGLAPYLANPNLGSFTGGVELATGTFNSGVVPTWVSALANVYSTAGGQSAINATVQQTVRTVIPEPATFGLTGIALIGVIAASRRRVKLRD